MFVRYLCIAAVVGLTICTQSHSQLVIEKLESDYGLHEIPQKYRDSLLTVYWPPVIEYPSKARSQSIKTVVWVRVAVGEQGRPTSAVADPCDQSGFGFEEAAEKAAKTALYRPHWSGPYPVTYTGFYPILFRDPGAKPRDYTVKATPHGIGYDAPVIVPLKPLEISYPNTVTGKLVEAEVWVHVLINKHGLVSHADMAKTTVQDPGFEHNALESVRAASFSIKEVDGKPVEYRAYVQVNFTIMDEQLRTMKLPLLRDSNYVDTRPQVVVNRRVRYPEEAKKAGMEGETVIAVLIDSSGQIVTARIDSSSGFELLDGVALSDAYAKVYEPAIKDKRKVACWIRYYVDLPSDSKQALKRLEDSLTSAQPPITHNTTIMPFMDDSSSNVIYSINKHGAMTGSSGFDRSAVDPDTPPKMTKYRRAQYPGNEYTSGHQGTTVLAALISETGELVGVEVVSSSGNTTLDRSAVDACPGHRFNPGVRSGKPVRSWMQWAIKFEPGSQDVVTPDEEKKLSEGLIIPETERVVTPDMPPSAIKSGHTGTVLLKIHVSDHGSVDKAEVARSSGYPELDSAAMSVAYKDTFKPAMYQGKPRSFSTSYKVIFQLKSH